MKKRLTVEITEDVMEWIRNAAFKLRVTKQLVSLRLLTAGIRANQDFADNVRLLKLLIPNPELAIVGLRQGRDYGYPMQ